VPSAHARFMLAPPGSYSLVRPGTSMIDHRPTSMKFVHICAARSKCGGALSSGVRYVVLHAAVDAK
jgi:hypothetical protein